MDRPSIEQIAKTLSEAHEYAGTDEQHGPYGHTIGMEEDPFGNGVTDEQGRPVATYWEIVEYWSDGQEHYGGDISNINEIPQYIEQLVDAMRANIIHGFAIKPPASTED